MPTPTPSAPTPTPTPTPTATSTPPAPVPSPGEPTESSATPSTSPSTPVPTTSPTTSPTTPAADPVPEPAAPKALDEVEAARWCVDLDPDDVNGGLDITAETVLTEVIAVLSAAGEPEQVDAHRLAEVDPSTAWLESLPACSDEDFLTAARSATSAPASS
ncbi:hypothetical protein ACFFX0_01025 [Citricoccus parietis]|uniref:Uncharacterized protein n=1 Tax=Citricoccus parietis TaxID=592307 RepID=A0ABV5FT42_9MICC